MCIKVPLAKSSSSCRVLDVDFADDDRGGELDKLELESFTKKENLNVKAGLLHHLSLYKHKRQEVQPSCIIQILFRQCSWT